MCLCALSVALNYLFSLNSNSYFKKNQPIDKKPIDIFIKSENMMYTNFLLPSFYIYIFKLEYNSFTLLYYFFFFFCCIPVRISYMYIYIPSLLGVSLTLTPPLGNHRFSLLLTFFERKPIIYLCIYLYLSPEIKAITIHFLLPFWYSFMCSYYNCWFPSMRC